jgi:hypothetical protein
MAVRPAGEDYTVYGARRGRALFIRANRAAVRWDARRSGWISRRWAWPAQG